MPIELTIPQAPVLSRLADALAKARVDTVGPVIIPIEPAVVDQCWTEMRNMSALDRLALAVNGPRVRPGDLERDGWGANVSGLALILNALAKYSGEAQVMLVVREAETWSLRGNQESGACECTTNACQKKKALFAATNDSCCLSTKPQPTVDSIRETAAEDRLALGLRPEGELVYFINSGGLSLFATYYSPAAP